MTGGLQEMLRGVEVRHPGRVIVHESWCAEYTKNTWFYKAATDEYVCGCGADSIDASELDVRNRGRYPAR